MELLKPCQACGGKRPKIRIHSKSLRTVVQCSRRACRVFGSFEKTERDAIESWNNG